MEKIKHLLTKIGLSQTEAEIYLTGLSYDTIGVNELVKQTKVKRTTIYHAMKSLLNKGLVKKSETNGKQVFTMTKPDNIKYIIKRKYRELKNNEDKLKDIIPLLNQKIKIKEPNINTTFFKGIEGIKHIIEETLYCRSRHWDIIAPAKNFFTEFDNDYVKYFLKSRKTRNITTRSLWEYDFSRKILTPDEIKQRKPRYLPKVMHGKFKSVITIFDDKVSIITSKKELSGILIQSEEIKDTMSAVFEGLWVNSEKYIEVKK